MEILKIQDLSFTYPLCEKMAVSHVSFDVEQGDFCVLCGATGSGKSTLLRLIKKELSPLGQKSGRVFVCGKDTDSLSVGESALTVGFVMQNPEMQIVTDKVWHELAFGLENLGVPSDVIAGRVAEMASYFGIESWYDRRVSELSGGQKQLLNLASVMVMNPKILILDEPTAQLDPIATSDFLATLKKLNEDLSLTVIIAEHSLEELVPMCDKLLVMDGGRLTYMGEPRSVVASLENDHPLIHAMPAAARLYRALGDTDDKCPLTVKEGRRFIQQKYDNAVRVLDTEECASGGQVALEFEDVCFRYSREQRDVVSHLDLKIFEGEIFCILGANGSGKTTTLGIAAGLMRAYAGRVRVFGKKLSDYKENLLYRECLSMLPQDVQTVFLKNTVREELADAGAVAKELPFDIEELYDKHPYDLSGGEQQLVALAKVLATKPRLLLLDEPTKALDAQKKLAMTDLLKKLKQSGVTVVAVTHDVEFTAECADRCAMFFGGRAVSIGTPRDFFSANNFYTTAASRMTKGYYDRAVTIEDTVRLCRLNVERSDGQK